MQPATCITERNTKQSALCLKNPGIGIDGVALEGELAPGTLSERMPILAEKMSVLHQAVVHLV